MSKPFRDASDGVGLDVVVSLPAPVIEKIEEAADERGETVAGWRRAELTTLVGGEGPGGSPRSRARSWCSTRSRRSAPSRTGGSRRAHGGTWRGGSPSTWSSAGCDTSGSRPCGRTRRPARRARRWSAARASRTPTGRPDRARRFLERHTGIPALALRSGSSAGARRYQQRLPDCLAAYAMSHYLLTSGGQGVKPPGRLFRRTFYRACRGQGLDASPLGKRPATPVEGQAGGSRRRLYTRRGRERWT